MTRTVLQERMHIRLLSTILLISTTSVSAEVLWRGDFETGTTEQWKGAPKSDGVKIVTEPVREGKYAVRIDGTKLNNTRQLLSFARCTARTSCTASACCMLLVRVKGKSTPYRGPNAADVRRSREVGDRSFDEPAHFFLDVLDRTSDVLSETIVNDHGRSDQACNRCDTHRSGRNVHRWVQNEHVADPSAGARFALDAVDCRRRLRRRPRSQSWNASTRAMGPPIT